MKCIGLPLLSAFFTRVPRRTDAAASLVSLTKKDRVIHSYRS
jgi:hypothetical protein